MTSPENAKEIMVLAVSLNQGKYRTRGTPTIADEYRKRRHLLEEYNATKEKEPASGEEAEVATWK